MISLFKSIVKNVSSLDEMKEKGEEKERRIEERSGKKGREIR